MWGEEIPCIVAPKIDTWTQIPMNHLISQTIGQAIHLSVFKLTNRGEVGRMASPDPFDFLFTLFTPIGSTSRLKPEIKKSRALFLTATAKCRLPPPKVTTGGGFFPGPFLEDRSGVTQCVD